MSGEPLQDHWSSGSESEPELLTGDEFTGQSVTRICHFQMIQQRL